MNTALEIAIDTIAPSPLNPRRTFDKAPLAELAASIREQGLLTPILLRPSPGGIGYELVAGERRWRAATLAGLKTIPAVVRELSDDRVREAALVENLQRADLHPLEEADAYVGLQRTGLTVEEIAAKLGKSQAFIYARLKLADLSPEVKKLVRSGQITTAVALLIARIPDAALRDEAAQTIVHESFDNEPISVSGARRIIDHNFQLDLSRAPFDTDDQALVPEAASCAACPNRTGNQPLLFGDIKESSLCTLPPCFHAKRQAHNVLVLAKAKASGRLVLSGNDARKILRDGSERSGYFLLDLPCYEDSKNRTYRTLVGKRVARDAVLVEKTAYNDDEVEAYVEALPAETVLPILVERGITLHTGSAGARSGDREAEKAAKTERSYRCRLHEEIRPRALSNLTLDDLPRFAAAWLRTVGCDDLKRLSRLTGRDYERNYYSEPRAPLAFTVDEALLLMLDLTLIPSTNVRTHYTPSDEVLAEYAKRFGIDTASLRSELAPKPKKASSKGLKVSQGSASTGKKARAKKGA